MENKLIGAKLVSIDIDEIIVEKDGSLYSLAIIDDEGDCCGYNDIDTKLLCEENSRPVITNIVIENDEEGEGEACTVTFFGESKPIAEIETYSSSGSGWGYGATVSVRCLALGIDEILSSW